MDVDGDGAHELTGYMIDPDISGDDSEEREKLRDIATSMAPSTGLRKAFTKASL